jgi:uncharacterized protein (DUF302 family)
MVVWHSSNCVNGRINMSYIKLCFVSMMVLLFMVGCGDSQPLTPERYSGSDELFQQLESNVAANPAWHKVTEIDHSRLGVEAGSSMPPARVLIFSNPQLETALIQQNPLVALDLPLRVLAYEESPGGESKVIYNDFAFVQSRYKLMGQSPFGAAYEQSFAEVLEGIPSGHIGSFQTSVMKNDGIITINSPFNFTVTMERILESIASQDDTVSFGSVDFKAQASEMGIDLLPNTMILFGAPEPGAKAMSKSPTLGLDAFCQKFLVWQDESGQVHLSFNDLLAIAERQGVSKSVALRVINYRLNKVFSEALQK